MLQSDHRPIVLGVTGGVASGKSTVVRFFVERGARSVSADDIARDLLATGSEMSLRVLAYFGQGFAVHDNPAQVDRAKLAKRIFADDRARRDLGELMHPTIHQLTQEYVEDARRDARCPMVAVEIPLLYENGLQSSVNRVLAAICSEDEQICRLMARHPALTEDDALRQIRAQMPTAEKARMADFTIDTGQALDMVRREADALFDRLTQRDGGQ